MEADLELCPVDSVFGARELLTSSCPLPCPDSSHLLREMPKRYILKSTSSSTSAPPQKRQRVGEIGAPNEDDVRKPPRDAYTGHSSSTSSRNLKPPAVPSLSNIAARAFARQFSVLYATENGIERTRPYLQAMPDPVANKLFEVMKEICPGYVTHAVIASVRRPNAKPILAIVTLLSSLTIVLLAGTHHITWKRIDSGQQANYTSNWKKPRRKYS